MHLDIKQQYHSIPVSPRPPRLIWLLSDGISIRNIATVADDTWFWCWPSECELISDLLVRFYAHIRSFMSYKFCDYQKVLRDLINQFWVHLWRNYHYFISHLLSNFFSSWFAFSNIGRIMESRFIHFHLHFISSSFYKIESRLACCR